MSNPKQDFFNECLADIKDEIPSDWEDISWLGDECPSYKANGLQIWIDHPDEEQRSTISSLRFGISRINEHGEFIEEIAEEAYFSVVLQIVKEAAQ